MLIIRNLLFVVPLVLGLNESVNHVTNVLPTRTDLDLYLRALERIVQSAGSKKNKIDTNLGFGLLLANVNLKNVMLRKEARLPKALKLQIQGIIKNINARLTFSKHIRSNKDDRYEFTYLCIDEDAWAARLPAFRSVTNAELLGFSEDYLMTEYSHWTWYEKRVMDFDNCIPNREQSDPPTPGDRSMSKGSIFTWRWKVLCTLYIATIYACLVSLRWNPLTSPPQFGRCSTPNECASFVENGSNFGYALVHRLLFLLVARYSKGCHVFSPELDAAFVEKMCGSIYEEASYIALNMFKSPDLLLEQIASCALAGHAEFFHHTWLGRLLKHQTPQGCFSGFLNTVYNRVNPLNSNTVNKCDGHVSGVAAAALSAVSRFIIETSY